MLCYIKFNNAQSCFRLRHVILQNTEYSEGVHHLQETGGSV